MIRLPLLALVGLAAALPASAQPDLDRHLHEHGAGLFAVTMGADGVARCEPTGPAEDAALQRSAAPALTVLPSLNPPEALGGLRIVLRATDQLLERPDALLSFRRAAARWERAIQTPMTVIYDVDYGPERFGGGTFAPSTIASASGAAAIARTQDGQIASIPTLIDSLKARAAGDAQLLALYDAIPVPTPSTAGDDEGPTNLEIPFGAQPTLQALGFLPAALDPDPAVTPFGNVPNLGFNSAFDFDFDPSDGVERTLIDFEAIVIHEMGHSLGFTSAIGQGGPPNNFFAIWDLFRVRPDAVEAGESLTDGAGWETAPRVVTPGPPATEVDQVVDGTTFFKATQVFFDGLSTLETSTATGAREGGDGQQASHWRDDAQRPPAPRDDGDRYIGIMDPNFGPGVRQLYKEPDLRVLEVLGYAIDYSPLYTSGLALSVGGDAVDLSAFVLGEVALGDVAVGASRDVPIEITNPDAETELAFDIEVVTDGQFPSAAAAPSLTLSAAEGTVAPGGAQTVQATIRGTEAAFAYGRLRIRTNADGRLVVELPVTFSVGGATEPLLVLAEGDGTDDGDLGALGDLAGDATASASFTLSNPSALSLDYEVLTSLKTRSFPLEIGTQRSAASARPLAAFLGAQRAAEAAVLFSADFSTDADFDRFASGGGVNGTWQRVTGGQAATGAHSTPDAAYFGTLVDGTYAYQNNASGDLVTPPIDVSGLDPSDLVVLSFNTYLDAELPDPDTGVVYDFATVLYSIDDGATYREIATNDTGGLLSNTTAWTSTMISVPALSGIESPVRFAFRFTSDGGLTAEGWYVDDIEVSTVEGGNGFFVTPRVGTLNAADGDVTVTLTASAGPLERQFYEGVVQVVTDQRPDDPAPLRLTFSVDDPVLPTLATDAGDPLFTAVDGETDQEVGFRIENEGSAPLSYLRLLEPALSRAVPANALTARSVPTVEAAALDAGDAPLDAESTSRRAALDDGDVLGSVVLPEATFALGLTQLPDGRVVAVEVGDADGAARSFVAAADLSEVQVLDPLTALGEQVLAVAYNASTETLWYAPFRAGGLFEAELRDDNTLRATGRTLDLGFQISALAYSDALDAFLMIPYNSDVVVAFTAEGAALPGYPLAFERGSFYQGLSVSGGVLEIGADDLVSNDAISYLQYDQFLRPTTGVPVAIDPDDLDGATAIRAHVRSRVDPDGVFYYLTRAGTDGAVRVVAVDPPDLAPETQTVLQAASPLFGIDLPAGERAAPRLRLTVRGAQGDVVRDTVSFLTNNPLAPIVRQAVRVEVGLDTSDDAPAGLPAAFAARGAFPNPTSGAVRVALDLPVEATVTVAVYDVLGRRVTPEQAATLPAGFGRGVSGTPDVARTLDLDVGALAAGLYLVRIQAGDADLVQRITIVR